jgi:hypothetical protein
MPATQQFDYHQLQLVDGCVRVSAPVSSLADLILATQYRIAAPILEIYPAVSRGKTTPP